MLNQTMQDPKLTNSHTYNLANQIFTSDVLRLSAEYILLNKSLLIDAETFEADLKQTHSRGYTFTAEDISSKFVQKGEFISHDTDRAAEALASSLLDYWFGSSTFSVSEAKRFVINKYREKILGYFKAVPKVEADKRMIIKIQDNRFGNARVSVYEHEVLIKIVRGELEVGDSIVEALNINGMPIKFNQLYPLFKRLIKGRGRDIILQTSDINSANFILAFVESLTFTLPVHRKEFLTRIYTILADEGWRI